MVSAVGFDLDGTLYDHRQYVRAGLREAAAVLEAAAGRDLTRPFLEAYFYRGIRDRTFDTVLDEHDISTDHVPTLVDAYHDHAAPLHPYPDAPPVLADLRERYRLGLLTGGRNGQWKVEQLGLSECFETVLVTPRLGMDKRDDGAFRRLLTDLGADPSEAVYVGDRPELDVAAPNRMGMTTVLVETGHRGTDPDGPGAVPDYTIDRLSALPALLDAL